MLSIRIENKIFLKSGRCYGLRRVRIRSDRLLKMFPFYPSACKATVKEVFKLRGKAYCWS